MLRQWFVLNNSLHLISVCRCAYKCNNGNDHVIVKVYPTQESVCVCVVFFVYVFVCIYICEARIVVCRCSECKIVTPVCSGMVMLSIVENEFNVPIALSAFRDKVEYRIGKGSSSVRLAWKGENDQMFLILKHNAFAHRAGV